MMTAGCRVKAALAAIAVGVTLTLAAGCSVGTTTYVVDGDTIDVTGVGRVRFIGIDTPEEGKCGYAEAKRRVEQLTLNQTTLLVPSANVDDKDRYDRYLRYVAAQGLDIGLVLLQEGLAHARYDDLDGYPRHDKQDEYRAADAATRNLCE